MKRIAIVLMACSIAAGVFAGGKTESKNAPAAQPAAQKKAPGALPIVDQPQTIRIFFQQEPQVLDYVNNKLTAYLEGKTNIKIDWDLVLSKDKTQKMNLILATNQGLPDVFMGGMDTSLVVAYAARAPSCRSTSTSTTTRSTCRKSSSRYRTSRRS
jgi:putative aldouronate transport system substrate-binding protein